MKNLHFAGYDFVSGPEGTVINRSTVQVSKFSDGDRVTYKDINLSLQYAGTVENVVGQYVYVRWNGRPYVSKEWSLNLKEIMKSFL